MMQVRRSIVLAAALASLLIVIGASAVAIWRSTAKVQAQISALHNAHLEAGNALAGIRANVYLGGILTRDYLLDTDPTHAKQYIDQFAAIRSDTEHDFEILKSVFAELGQIPALERLHQEVNAYWDPTEIALDWAPEEKAARRSEVLKQRIRRREEISALSDQSERLISENFARERERTNRAAQEFRSSLAWAIAIALLLSIGIAAATLVRMIGLERKSLAAESELRRLSAQVRTTQEQERKFLSRELHDQVGQMLTGIRMELSSMARLHGDASSELATRIANAKGTVEQTLGVVRNIAMLVRPSMLDDLGLKPAIAWLIKDVSRTSQMEIDFDVGAEVDLLPDNYRTCLYRIVQEALTNAARHSGAGKCFISIQTSRNDVVGSVEDDGSGFDVAAARGRSLGLVGMEERVRELGGEITITSAARRGTRVEFRLPIPRTAEVLDDSGLDRGRSRDRSSGAEAPA